MKSTGKQAEKSQSNFTLSLIEHQLITWRNKSHKRHSLWNFTSLELSIGNIKESGRYNLKFSEITIKTLVLRKSTSVKILKTIY